jgi:hypothetical protein
MDALLAFNAKQPPRRCTRSACAQTKIRRIYAPLPPHRIVDMQDGLCDSYFRSLPRNPAIEFNMGSAQTPHGLRLNDDFSLFTDNNDKFAHQFVFSFARS